MNSDGMHRDRRELRPARAHLPRAARGMARTVAAAATLTAALALPVVSAAPSRAEPAVPSCGLSLALLCAMVPMLPNLDHDVDLTKNPDGLDGLVVQAPVPMSSLGEDSLPPLNQTVDSGAIGPGSP